LIRRHRLFAEARARGLGLLDGTRGASAIRSWDWATMTFRTEHSGSRRTDGFIIVVVLWLLATLAVLTTAFSAYVKSTAVSTRVGDERAKVEALVDAALEFTIYRRSIDKFNATAGSFSFGIANSTINIDFVSEGAWIDLNAAPRSLIAGLFEVLGATKDDANQYADRVVAWRTPPTSSAETAEDALYESAGLPYLPRSGPFAHINELWLVLGLPASLVERALPFVTIFSGRPEVNVFDAPAEVIAALPGISRTRIDKFLALRDTAKPDWQSALETLGADQVLATTARSETVRVFVRITSDNGAQTRAEVTILPSQDNDYHVLSWSDDFTTAASATDFRSRSK